MSFLNLSLFRKKNKDLYDNSLYSGYVLRDNCAHDTNDALIHCAIKGLIIFCATVGCVNGVLSEFDISYNFVLVDLYIFLASMALSFMHIKKWIFNLGYPLLFILFSFSLFQNRIYANSGFQALINILNESYGSHFLLNFTRESTEMVSDRYATITIMAIFVGIFIAIIVNVGVFNDMYFLTVFDFTFWPLQMGIYIGKYPSFFSILFVFFAFFASYILKFSGHYQFVYPEKEKKYYLEFSVKDKKISQSKNYIFHKSNGRNMVGICTFIMILSLAISIFGSLSIKQSEMDSVQSGELKARMDEGVKIFVQNGISGMFNRYESAGGVSGGKLGGVSSVRPDYETDLILTFVPYAYDRIYLRSYVGANYTTREWKKPDIEIPFMHSIKEPSDAAFLESKLMTRLMDRSYYPEMSGKFVIENVDAGINFCYTPYYPSKTPAHSMVTEENVFEGVTPYNQKIEVEYIPFSVSLADVEDHDESFYLKLLKPDEKELALANKTDAYNNYLNIPDHIKDEIMSYHDVIGESKDRAEIISLVRNFLYTCYTYDMSPGSTPYNEDFVTYFLGSQKRGYCSHFATAGTLLLRSYGVPARYAEGYVVDQSDISEGKLSTDYLVTDLFYGMNTLDTSQVVTVEIPDGNAHAWTEVYIDGFGWIPVEMTPPSDEDEQVSYSDFLAALSGLLTAGNAEMSNQTQIEGPTINRTFLDQIKFDNSPVLTSFMLFILILVFIPLFIRLAKDIALQNKRSKDFKSGKFGSTISYEYRKALKKLKKKNPEAILTLPEDVRDLLLTSPKYAELAIDSVEDYISLTQKCFFAEDMITKDEATKLIKFYKRLQKI